MRVLLSCDMEGISQITNHRECWPAFEEYWATGRSKMTRDVRAAVEGLLLGGATSVVVADGHGTGDWSNIIWDALPSRAEPLGDHPRHIGWDAAFQVGLHARCGTPDGFISHTNVPEFRIAVDGTLITECHDDAWTAGAPVLGITGDAALATQLDGILANTPYLAVKRSRSRIATMPIYPSHCDSDDALREFARVCARGWRACHTPALPNEVTVDVSMNSGLLQDVVGHHGLTRKSNSVLTMTGSDWRRDIKPGLSAAIGAAIRPWFDAQGSLDLGDEAALQRQDAEQLARMQQYIIGWMETNYPAWLDE